ncbi:MAG: class D sortase [Gemmatimonadota bacterium]|nr:class D sortase [Gemmatimonadota bacterium]
MRRRLGQSLIVFGALLLSFAGARYAHGALRQGAARRAWEAAQAQSAFAVVHASLDAGRLGGPWAIGSPIARMTIPALGLDEIVIEGVSDEELNAGPGHLPGSVLPGERGNAVISAHRDRHFSTLGALQVGDEITTETAGARRMKWIVIARRVVRSSDAALFSTPDATLTLTTCWPIRYVGTAPERLIVTAKPVGWKGTASG